MNTKMIRHAKPAIRLFAENQAVSPTETYGFDEPIDHAAQSGSRQQGTRPIHRTSTCALRLSEICSSEIAITAAPMGTLMKNTQRHEACSISQPPRTGPIAVVIAVNPDQVPIA